MNQYYSAELSQKILRGLRESYLKGNYTGGAIPFGYDVINKKLVINPIEGEAVKEMFRLFLQGYTAEYIATELKRRGIRNKRGEYLKVKAIYKMLKNSCYNGKTVHQNTVYENIHPKIIDDDTWQRACIIHESNKIAPGKKKDIFEYILSGKLYCAKCHHSLKGISGTSRWGTKHYYYVCNGKNNKSNRCSLPSYRKQELEDLVINKTLELLSNEDSLHYLAKEICVRLENATKQDTALKALESKRNAALKASRNLIAALEQGIITEQTKIRLKELETQITQLDFDIDMERQRSHLYVTPDKVYRFIQNAVTGDPTTFAFRKALVKHLIKSILIDDNKIIINYHFTTPIDPPKKESDKSIRNIIKSAQQITPVDEIHCSSKRETSPPH